MDAKEYLQSVKDAAENIEKKLKMIENLQEMRFRVTQTLKADIVSGGGNGGGFSGASDALLDLERELSEDVKKYAEMLREAKALLAKVRNKNYYDVLYKHYLESKSLKTIADEMGYCKRNVGYIHDKAVKVFRKVLEARET